MSTLAPEVPAPPKTGPQWGLIISVAALTVTVLGIGANNYSQWVLLKDSDTRQETRLTNMETRQSELKDSLGELKGDVREIKAIVSALREQQKSEK